jgi:hypothetical protein
MLNKILLMFLLMTTAGYATDETDVLKSLETPADLGQVNDNFRRTATRLRAIEAGVSLTTGVTGILPTANGGTGKDFSAVAANAIPYFSSTGTMGNIGIGTTGYVLTAGNPPSWIAPGHVIYSWSGQVESGGTGTGLVTSTSTITDLGTTNSVYLYLKDRNVTGASRTTTLLRTKFRKISSISSVVIYAFVNENDNSSGATVSAQLNINGSTVDTGTQANTIFEWVNSTALNVSGLTNGTVYDMTIAIKTNGNINPHFGYLGSVVIFGY